MGLSWSDALVPKTFDPIQNQSKWISIKKFESLNKSPGEHYLGGIACPCFPELDSGTGIHVWFYLSYIFPLQNADLYWVWTSKNVVTIIANGFRILNRTLESTGDTSILERAVQTIGVYHKEGQMERNFRNDCLSDVLLSSSQREWMLCCMDLNLISVQLAKASLWRR